MVVPCKSGFASGCVMSLWLINLFICVVVKGSSSLFGMGFENELVTVCKQHGFGSRLE